jgi:endonuclease YncB( thermonuclease family)
MKSALALAALLLPSLAHADPCTAPLPHKAGETFSGRVNYIVDGDGLCLEPGIEVRLADFNAPELHSSQGPAAKATLHRIAYGKPAQCTVTRGRNGRTTSYDRVIAVCTVNGRSVGDLMRGAGVVEGGR